MKPRCDSSFRLEVHRRAVHAIALPGRAWAVVEHVAEMAAAPAAMHLGARHEEAAVLRGADGPFQRLIEAGPAGAAFELGIRCKHLLAAAGASELAVPLLRIQRAGSSALGAVLAQH